MKKELLYPFDKNTGDLINYVGGWRYKKEDIDWLPKFQWWDYLELIDFSKGRSAMNFIFKSVVKPNSTYPMFFKDFTDCYRNICKGFIKGDFTVVKRGSNYGILYIEREIENEEK